MTAVRVTRVVRKRGAVRFVLDWVEPNGKRHRVAHPTLVEAERARAEIIARLEQAGSSGLSVNPNVTVQAYAAQWLDTLNVKPATLATYRFQLEKHILPEIGHLRLRQVDRDCLLRTFRGKLQAGLSAETVRLFTAITTRIYECARESGIVLVNPCQGIAKRLRLQATIREQREEVHALTAAQAEALLEAVDRVLPANAALAIRLMLRTGLRIGEASALRWEDVNFFDQEVTVRATLAARTKTRDTIEARLNSPKSGRRRRVDLSPSLVTALRSLKVSADTRQLRTGSAVPWIFATAGGDPIGPDLLRAALRRALAKAGLPTSTTPHTLRHTYATLQLARGVPASYVQAQLGHASITMTVDVYGRWMPTTDKRFAQWDEDAAIDRARVAATGSDTRSDTRLHNRPPALPAMTHFGLISQGRSAFDVGSHVTST